MNAVIKAEVIKRPLRHQQEAIDSIHAELTANDRATAAMACGTGKTLLALWVAERLNSKMVVVLVPSIALIDQFLREWVENVIPGEMQYLAVCSDASVGDDMLTADQLGIDVTTSLTKIRRFLESETGKMKVIFCTYHSSRVLSVAVGKSHVVDLAIFDEAHRTVGSRHKRFSIPISDAKFNAKKRLFLTATMRVVDINGNFNGIGRTAHYSMDSESDYGKLCYSLSFREAINRELICNYKVIVSVITDTDVDRAFLRKKQLSSDYSSLSAHELAAYFALEKAMKKYNIKKAISYHGTIESAQQFAELGQEYSSESIKFLHVNSTTPAVDRSRIFDYLNNCNRAIITNARCLTEGVDVPSVDMVAFMSPKRSKIDIVQALGRALRRNKNKSHGFAFVPLFVNLKKYESIELAVKKSQYKEVWNVLGQLNESDDLVAGIYRRKRQDLIVPSLRSHPQVRENPITIELEEDFLEDPQAIVEAFDAVTIEHLSDRWDYYYQILRQYFDKHGDCKISIGQHKSLYRWMLEQRRNKKTLPSDKVMMLDAIKFSWNPKDDQWNHMFYQLKDHFSIHGSNIPQHKSTLRNWALSQRKAYTEGRLARQKVQRLKRIGFVFDGTSFEETWNSRIAQAKAFISEYGHSNFSGEDVPDNLELGKWRNNVLQKIRVGDLSENKVQQLSDIGFDFNIRVSIWNQYLNTLIQYLAEHPEDQEISFAPKKLKDWVKRQRRSYNSSTLKNEYVQALNNVGFIWNAKEASRQSRINQLRSFKAINGHCKVTDKNSEEWPGLNSWVQLQRARYKEGSLSKDEVEELVSLGFVFKIYKNTREMLNMMKKYKKSNGHCKVQKRDDADWPGLNSWVKLQRAKYKKGELSHTEIASLESIGFVWSLRQRRNCA